MTSNIKYHILSSKKEGARHGHVGDDAPVSESNKNTGWHEHNVKQIAKYFQVLQYQIFRKYRPDHNHRYITICSGFTLSNSAPKIRGFQSRLEGFVIAACQRLLPYFSNPRLSKFRRRTLWPVPSNSSPDRQHKCQTLAWDIS